MNLSAQVRQEKLAKLLAAEGYETLEEMALAILSDAVSPAICIEPDCDHVAEMEPDQEEGHCELCGKNTVVAALVLAELIEEAGMDAAADNVGRIRELNDALRTTFAGGVIAVTAGIDALPPELKAIVLMGVRNFREFNAENDPHHEHDFGAFEIDGESFFWKIDNYNRDMDGGSEDPADPDVTTRVLTIMLASEY